eukprot:553962-Pelagomonas_calceolata.AAC.1
MWARAGVAVSAALQGSHVKQARIMSMGHKQGSQARVTKRPLLPCVTIRSHMELPSGTEASCTPKADPEQPSP